MTGSTLLAAVGTSAFVVLVCSNEVAEGNSADVGVEVEDDVEVDAAGFRMGGVIALDS